MQEFIFVIDAVDLDVMPTLYKNPFTAKVSDINGLLMVMENGSFIPRGKAEEDPNYKQIIPYVLLQAGDGTYFTYKRAGSEKRLTNKYSMGIGGHINTTDVNYESEEFLLPAMRRELEEELEVDDADYLLDLKKLQMCGLIYDPIDAVGEVHLGVVYKLQVPTEDKSFIYMGSEGKDGQWLSRDKLSEMGDTLENWSRIVLDADV